MIILTLTNPSTSPPDPPATVAALLLVESCELAPEKAVSQLRTGAPKNSSSLPELKDQLEVD